MAEASLPAALLALAVSLFDAVFAWSRSGAPLLGYWGLCAVLALAAACGLGAVAGAARAGAVPVLSLFCGLCGGFASGRVAAVATTVVAGVLLWALAPPSAWRAGLAAAFALAAGFAAGPWAAERLDWLAWDARAPGWAGVLAFGAGLAAALRALRGVVGPFALAGALAFLGWLPALGRPARAPLPPAPAEATAQPSIVLLILDTVRADHLSIYGYERDTTPRLAAFLAAQPSAVRYPLAFSPATWTLPAHASLFSGLLPSHHGIDAPSVFGDSGSFFEVPLRAERTLAEALRASGYRSGFLFANPSLSETPGLERGFDRFVRPPGHARLRLAGEGLRARLAPQLFRASLDAAHPPADVVNRAGLAFLDECAPGPCFLVLNHMEAHAPYLPSRPHAGRYAALPRRFAGVQAASARDVPAGIDFKRARYDEEIRSLDAALGELLDALAARGILEGAWLVVTSDHGEAFGEHGATEHGTTIHGEVARVPLVIRPPTGAVLPPRSDAVGLLDVTATLAAVGSGAPLGTGRDLRDPTVGPAPVRTEFFGDPFKAGMHGALAGTPARAVAVGRARLIDRQGRAALYLLDDDPEERIDRALALPRLVGTLRDELPPLAALPAPEAERELSEAKRAQLRALGYLPDPEGSASLDQGAAAPPAWRRTTSSRPAP